MFNPAIIVIEENVLSGTSATFDSSGSKTEYQSTATTRNNNNRHHRRPQQPPPLQQKVKSKI